MKKWLQSAISLLLVIVMVLGSASVARAEGDYIVIDPNDASWDIPLSELEVSCGDYEPNGGASEGPAYLAVDGNPATMWHTDWQGTSRANHWFQFEVTGEYAVNGLRYQPRQTGNSNDEKGAIGILSGGLTASSAGITAALLLGLLASIFFKSSQKRL